MDTRLGAVSAAKTPTADSEAVKAISQVTNQIVAAALEILRSSPELVFLRKQAAENQTSLTAIQKAVTEIANRLEQWKIQQTHTDFCGIYAMETFLTRGRKMLLF
jgi:5-methylcytosine-specific restriction endonuclease McrBC regulatory subunit McrC